MIDTHAHIYLPEFDDDREQMIQRAKAAGVSKIFMPNIDSTSVNSMLALQSRHPEYCFPMMGLHPCSVNQNYKSEISLLEEYFNNNNEQFYGVGECGLDYYWDKSFIAEQKEVFRFQVSLAKKNKIPIIIHSRDAVDDCIEIIRELKDDDLHGVFHCFSGSTEQLEKIIALDFFAGIGGVVTFKNGGLDKIIEKKHLPFLVLETDAPYLAPAPFRGKRNEPSYLTYVVTKLSDVLQMPEEEIRKVTTENAGRLFE